MKRLQLAQQADAGELLSRDPFALLVGMLLDQQFPMERAFAGPRLIADRLGVDRLEPEALSSVDPKDLIAVMTGPPAVHRYPRSMAGRVQALAQQVVTGYGGDAAAVWRAAADGDELLRRLTALPGFGPQKAKIFLALLGKQLGVRPDGWRAAAGDYGATEGYRSAADVVDEASLQRVREHKQAMKAKARTGQ